MDIYLNSAAEGDSNALHVNSIELQGGVGQSTIADGHAFSELKVYYHQDRSSRASVHALNAKDDDKALLESKFAYTCCCW